MSFLIGIAIILSQLPVPVIDRHEPDRERRLQSIAIAIERASERATCTGAFALETCRPIASSATRVAAELIVLAAAETDLRRNVHADECGPHECDASRYRVRGVIHIEHKARSLWQLHRAPSWSLEKWESLAGLSQEATNAAAWEAAKFMAGGHGACKTTAGAFAY